MTKKKKGLLPSLEVLIIIVFFGCFIMWAMSKCNETKQLYEDEIVEENEEPILSPSAIPEKKPKKPKPVPPPTPAPTASVSTPAPAPASTATPAAVPSFTKLYIVIDSLNMRKAPSLDSLIMGKLRLFDEVIYLNETTEWRQKIKLSATDIANEPWVKIRNRQGTIGWVYGAGINFYKQRRIPNQAPAQFPPPTQ